MTNGNVSKILAAATVLCALAACNNNKHPINTEVKAQPKGVAGGIGAAASGCASTASLSEKDITDAPDMSHFNKLDARYGIDCSLEIVGEGKAPVCIKVGKAQGSYPAAHGSIDYTWVAGAKEEIAKYGLSAAQVSLVETTGDESQPLNGQFNLEFQGAPGQSEYAYQANGDRFNSAGAQTGTLNFVIGDGKNSVNYTATMQCNVTEVQAAKKPAPAPEKSGVPAPEKTTAPVPAPEKTGVPAPQKTGTPAQQQAPAKGGSQQK